MKLVQLFLFCVVSAWVPAWAFQAAKPLEFANPVQDKNFYLLSAIERAPAAREAFKTSAILARIAAERLAALDHAVTFCNADNECNAAAFQWTEAQIDEAGKALADLYRTSPPLHALTDNQLRDSGMYVRYQGLTGAQLLERAWADCLHGTNHIIDVYALGKPPRYPEIDSITYDPKSPAWRNHLEYLTQIMQEDPARLDLAFSSSLRFALAAMNLSNRDEAGRLEPMENGEHAAAFRRAKTLDWARYPYTVIVVPGSGNERTGIALSLGGKFRDEIAVKRFREGKAPFILVSGGYVHPSQTPYAEALEMKRDLMTRFAVPEDAIIIDPHARHTTTNMRNAARLMYRYGLPFDRKALVTSDPSQSTYIEGAVFAKRCLDELGYVPYKIVGRTSIFDLEFIPAIESLQADPREPLDP